jgi:hypothetical protein
LTKATGVMIQTRLRFTNATIKKLALVLICQLVLLDTEVISATPAGRKALSGIQESQITSV